MSLGLHICCDCCDPVTGKDCESKIHGTEAVDMVDLPGHRGFTGGVDLGHRMIRYGQGHQCDLVTAAANAGWHWDGREWACVKCARKAIVSGELPTTAKLEAMAHSFNL